MLGQTELKKRLYSEGRLGARKKHLARVQVWIWFSLGINLLLFLVYHREWERRSYNHRWHTKSLFSCAESPGKHLQKNGCVRGFLQEASVLYLAFLQEASVLYLAVSLFTSLSLLGC